jgi:hypothetical protein
MLLLLLMRRQCQPLLLLLPLRQHLPFPLPAAPQRLCRPQNWQLVCLLREPQLLLVPLLLQALQLLQQCVVLLQQCSVCSLDSAKQG